MFKSVIGNVRRRVELLKEIKRVLKPEGSLVFTTYYRYATFRRALLLSLVDSTKFFVNIIFNKNLEYSSWVSYDNCYVHMPSIKRTSKEIKNSGLILKRHFHSKTMPYVFFIVEK
jgi:ubiquinone/menaquinone biosynthesis C-methylase UbiE